MTLRQFVRRFPEFRDSDPTLIQSKLDDAAEQIEDDVWGGKANQGQAYLAAHLLAINPMGEVMRLEKDSDKTVYLLNYKKLLRQVAYGFRVI